MGQRTRLALSGTAAGLINGLLGAGGGMLLVPMLIRLCDLAPKKAFATSVAIIFPLCILSVIGYARDGVLQVGTALPYLVGGVLGGLVAGRLMRRISVVWLRRGFALLLLYGGLRMVLR